MNPTSKASPRAGILRTGRRVAGLGSRSPAPIPHDHKANQDQKHFIPPPVDLEQIKLINSGHLKFVDGMWVRPKAITVEEHAKAMNAALPSALPREKIEV